MARHEIPCVACKAAVLVIMAESTAERDRKINAHGWQNQSRGTVCGECKGRPIPAAGPAADGPPGKGKAKKKR